MNAIPMYCDHCGFQLDYVIGSGGDFPPFCENGCKDGRGNKKRMKLRKGEAQPAQKIEMEDLVMSITPVQLTWASSVVPADNYVNSDCLMSALVYQNI